MGKAKKNIFEEQKIHSNSSSIEQDRTLKKQKPSKGQKDTSKPSNRVSKSDDFVWKLPGFDKYGFYAAANYLSKQEKNQGLSWSANNTQASTNIQKGLVTASLDRQMLDYLALLFARVKKTDASVKDSDASAQHVTATALKKVDTGLEIWIAKNDGPKDEDEEFRVNLEAWFNRNGEWETNADSMTSEIKDFWRDRHHHYARSIKSLWNRIRQGPDRLAKVTKGRRNLEEVQRNTDQIDQESIDLDKSYNALKKIYRNEMANLELFEKDWNEANSLCSNPENTHKQLKLATDTDLSSDIEPQSYETSDLSQPQNHLELARDFSKLIKAIRLLGTVAKAIKIFTQFRENLAQDRVKLKFLDAIESESLDLEPEACKTIAKIMKSWIGPNSNQKFKKEITERVEALQVQSKFPRYFHCELQMLDKFLEMTMSTTILGLANYPVLYAGELFGAPRSRREILMPICGPRVLFHFP